MALGDLIFEGITLIIVLLTIFQLFHPQAKNNQTYIMTIMSALLYGLIIYLGNSSLWIVGELTTGIIIFIATVKQFIWYPNISKLKSYQPWLQSTAVIYLAFGLYLTNTTKISLLTIVSIFALVLVIGSVLLYFLLLKKE